MDKKNRKSYLPFYVGITFLLIIFVIELVSILKLNGNFFTYTLDDPYIHLALAENIRHGHYGINANEFSAPSSSIIWPFILAPFANITVFPLILNCAIAVTTVILFVKVLYASIQIDTKSLPSIISAAVVLLILATNMVGIIFTGMEHSLQVLLVVLIVNGLIVENEKGIVPAWLLAAIILAPLVRYECAAISVAALIYLVQNKYYKQALIASVLMGVCVGGFSGYLIMSGAGPFSASIVAKSSVVQNGGNFHSIVLNLTRSLFANRQGTVMIFAAIALIAYRIVSKDTTKGRLVIPATTAIFLHFIAGRFGWYHRYEIYIWTFALLICFYLWLPFCINFLAEKPAMHFWLAAVLMGIVIAFAGKPYIYALFTLPVASNNIYEQQYQMHRFAVDYYKRPVAVNDLGYVSYKNSNYVLDLWGLGSQRALQFRMDKKNGHWMRDICAQSDIGLVMIYDSRFKNIPDKWIKAGTLHLSNRRITAAGDTVSFYATNQRALKEINRELPPFIDTLPAGVKFILSK